MSRSRATSLCSSIPFAISQRVDRWSVEAHRTLVSFFQTIIDAIRSGRQDDREACRGGQAPRDTDRRSCHRLAGKSIRFDVRAGAFEGSVDERTRTTTGREARGLASDRLPRFAVSAPCRSSVAKDLGRIAAQAGVLRPRTRHCFRQVAWDDRKRRTTHWDTGVVRIYPSIEDGKKAVTGRIRARHECAGIGEPFGFDHLRAEQLSSGGAPRNSARDASGLGRLRTSGRRSRFTATDEHNDRQEKGLSHTFFYHRARIDARAPRPA